MRLDIRDRRVVIGAITAALVVLVVFAFVARPQGDGPRALLPVLRSPGGPPVPSPTDPFPNDSEPTATPAPEAVPDPVAGAPVTSAPLATRVPPPRTPTPPPQERHWRYTGVVTDAQGRPLPNVCIAIGRRGCHQYSWRTDDRGVYIIDFPEVQPLAEYELFFFVDGVEKRAVRVRPSASATFNVVLN